MQSGGSRGGRRKNVEYLYRKAQFIGNELQLEWIDCNGLNP